MYIPTCHTTHARMHTQCSTHYIFNTLQCMQCLVVVQFSPLKDFFKAPVPLTRCSTLLLPPLLVTSTLLQFLSSPFTFTLSFQLLVVLHFHISSTTTFTVPSASPPVTSNRSQEGATSPASILIPLPTSSSLTDVVRKDVVMID